MGPNIHSLQHAAALHLQHASEGYAHIRDHEVRLFPTINLNKTNPNMFRLSPLPQFLGRAREERNIGNGFGRHFLRNFLQGKELLSFVTLVQPHHNKWEFKSENYTRFR
jgi:hypothetical protein